MKIFKVPSMILMMGVIYLSGCTPIQNALFQGADLIPPQFLRAYLQDERNVMIDFSEETSVVADTVKIVPHIDIVEIVHKEHTVHIMLEEEVAPGDMITIALMVEDHAKNMLNVVAELYGFNGNLPKMLINEVTPNGSKTRPDMVELFVTEGGNMGGVALQDGSPTDWENRIIFPAMEVAAGDYIIVHFSPESTDEEVNEMSTKDESGGRGTHDEAWDFWVPEGTGLVSTNGVLTLTAAPEGAIIDALIYTKRTSDSDEKYRGFGKSRLLLQVDEVASTGEWEITQEAARPEDAVWAGYSTSTRSLSRASVPTDTNSREDWHTVPTKGSTFGTINTDDRHDPS